ncbi:DUF2163 domain-containing protein [Salipiger bermudensis]|uniref:Bacteriophage phiJL001 Gp84 C-terminal domain-containing protein n=1 Tax=Salipiger bermudensis (strain DSM 26914 / JCM 13377 / KCTC 12554 / HTCC2601) TaxID=314265 RepID=Q0FJK2_SALBH|nr:DUF2163 domain-containing protein [Salipiger bermudensis]EAU44356.1 hypothetical protein R2601_08411 [Salipiger bermudensis HTCC2601]
MGAAELHVHLAGGLGTVARCWAVTRADGVALGFTDHDRDLAFDGQSFRADTGLSAKTLQQATGLSVDNSEAMGALRDDALSEADIEAGRFDGAEVVCWLVNWQDVSQRRMLFRGSIGEIRRAGGAFHAELRGLTEALNRPLGRVYQAPCTAVLGDASCRVDLGEPGYFHEGAAVQVQDNRELLFGALTGFEAGWFQRGRLVVLSGAAQGLTGAIKRDRFSEEGRRIELWLPLGATLVAGDLVRLEAGCDKRFETCRLKFNNVLNFQGFPDIPEEDWMLVHPTRAKAKGGGSRR